MTSAINNTQNDIALDNGRVVPASSSLTIDSSNFLAFANDNSFWSYVSAGDITVNDGTQNLDISDAIDHLKGYLQKFAMTSDYRPYMAPNRIPAGYSLYVSGIADDLSAGTYGGGVPLKFSAANSSRIFGLLDHYYVIGARAIWELCSSDNYFDATLYAPASTGLNNQAGDFDKYQVDTGKYMIIPAAPGQGAWDIDLTAKHTNTNILKCTPVPQAGNTGYFDYDADSNVLTVNSAGKGGYNLFDCDVNLHSFGRNVWGKSISGSESSLDITELVGKKLFNSWRFKFELKKDGGSLALEKPAVVLIIGSKGNISPW